MPQGGAWNRYNTFGICSGARGRRDKTVLSPRESFDSCDGQLIARRKRVAETVTVETVTTGKWYTVGVCSGRFLVTGSKVMLGGRG